ncbi:MAG TPA: DUF2188 domain-containing protein [Pyrinomonadaceae bacterium]|nr:DUF2188 domain-containing protein [Pyrinomonadaceae bacterium]
MTKRVIQEISETGEFSKKEIESVVKAVHVAPANGGWCVRKSGKTRIDEDFASEEAAVEYAENISRNKGVDLIIHSRDGRVTKINGK